MISSSADGVSVDNTTNEVTVTPQTDRRLVVYSITDQDGLSSSAVVSVVVTVVVAASFSWR